MVSMFLDTAIFFWNNLLVYIKSKYFTCLGPPYFNNNNKKKVKKSTS